MNIITTILYPAFMVLILFGVTIFVHELGHFLFARWLGLHAETFAIGFGPAIWKRKINGVTYKIGWIPAGGYVSLPQMEPNGGRRIDENGNEVTLPRVDPWRKILVAAAGAFFNILLAFFLAYVIYWAGKPSTPQETSSVVGYVATNSQAYAEGLRAGDRIVSANEAEVHKWQDFLMAGALSPEVKLEVQRQEETLTMVLASAADGLGMKGARGVPGVDGVTFCRVGSVEPGGSAAAAGVQSGDFIRSFDGVDIYSIAQLVDLVGSREGQTVPMEVERGGERIALRVTPELDPRLERARIGIRFDVFFRDRDTLVHIPPGEQISGHASLIMGTLRALVTPAQAKYAASGLGGPPMIFAYLYAMVQAGFIMALWFTCLLNVNLAIINLVPLPVLDGGHICFALWEMIVRRPVHERVVTGLTTVFAVLLISAMLFLSVRDVDRMMNAGGGGNEPAISVETNGVPATAP
jgi:regulator of sigma E protease